MKNYVTVRDALYNLSASVADSPDRIAYGRGCLVGAVAILMGVEGLDFTHAVSRLRQLIPADANPECVPISWRSDFGI